MTHSIEKRLKILELLDKAIANIDDEWGNTPEEWEIHLEILIAGGAIEEDISYYSYTCPYIKIDGSICDKNCTRIEGCRDHWKRIRTEGGSPCKKCGKITRGKNGYCRNHSSWSRYIPKGRRENSI